MQSDNGEDSVETRCGDVPLTQDKAMFEIVYTGKLLMLAGLLLSVWHLLPASNTTIFSKQLLQIVMRTMVRTVGPVSSSLLLWCMKYWSMAAVTLYVLGCIKVLLQQGYAQDELIWALCWRMLPQARGVVGDMGHLTTGMLNPICTLDFSSNGSLVTYTILDEQVLVVGSTDFWNRRVVMIQQKEPSCTVCSRNRWLLIEKKKVECETKLDSFHTGRRQVDRFSRPFVYRAVVVRCKIDCVYLI